jgi:hypothetical protein
MPQSFLSFLLVSMVLLVHMSAFSSESMNSDSNSVSNENSMTYSSTLKMRENLRMGAGVSVGGQLGVWGLNAELNFEDENSAIAGVGAGPGYRSVQLAWKHSFEGDYLAPYYSAGYSHWYNSDTSNNQWKESSILNRVLTADEKRKGQFGTDFLNVSMGLQYNQLSGDFYGFSCYAEILGMYEIKRSQVIPSGAIGSTYYF